MYTCCVFHSCIYAIYSMIYFIYNLYITAIYISLHYSYIYIYHYITAIYFILLFTDIYIFIIATDTAHSEYTALESKELKIVVFTHIESRIVNNKILDWIETWLTGRSQSIVLNGISSHPVQGQSGVPQGTVLGPLMFLLYINDISNNIHYHYVLLLIIVSFMELYILNKILFNCNGTSMLCLLGQIHGN